MLVRKEWEELVSAALAYGAAQEKYRAEYDRAPPKSIPREGSTEVIFDEEQMAAVRALHAARERMEKLAESMYATAKAEQDGCDSCNGTGEPVTLRDGSWLCEMCMEKRPDREAATQFDDVARSEALDRERGAGR